MEIKNYGYTVKIIDDNEKRILQVVEELRESEADPKSQINWFNFNDYDIYYSDNCYKYIIAYADHENKEITLQFKSIA